MLIWKLYLILSENIRLRFSWYRSHNFFEVSGSRTDLTSTIHLDSYGLG